MKNFDMMGLPEPLMHALACMEFKTPTPIQEKAIPPALEGRDILGSAQTGTGKTGAFGIPLITKLLASNRGSALVMTPTRELAVQVIKALQEMVGKAPIKTALLIGGESMPKQLQQLRMRPRIIVGTPGRINDHLTRGSLMLHDAGFLVLDETDRMLDMGFAIQIEKIMKYLPKQRQTLLFSATLPKNIVKLSQQYLKNPVRVAAGETTTPATNIKQEVLHLSDGEKYKELLTQLTAREGSVIMFVKTKWGADKMATRLKKAGYSADAIHGDLRQNKRDRVMQGFRDREFRILVATDIAARGLDISHIEHVINYDLPQCPEDYIHRIGRTARAGAVGEAICFVTPGDRDKWRAIQRMLDPKGDHTPDDEPRKFNPGKSKSSKKPFRFRGGSGNSRGGNKGAKPRGGSKPRAPKSSARAA
jgi:superfamily II DNA/RNA helicase